MGPAAGAGVLMKKLRSRFFVLDARYWTSTTVDRHSSRWTARLHWFFHAFGRSRLGVVMSGGDVVATPVGCARVIVGLAVSLLYVNRGASGGLFVRNVNVFIRFGLKLMPHPLRGTALSSS